MNPAAGNGRSKNVFPSIKEFLDLKNIPYEFRFTSRPGEAKDIARGAVNQGFSHVISIGGDGTAHEVVNGIAGSELILGLVPAGSGNDFPKAAGIPLETPNAIRKLANRQTRRIDLGLFGDEFFVNGLGIGLDGAVAFRFNEMKKLRGELGYLWGAIQETLRFKGFNVKVKTPDWNYTGTALLLGASNGQCHGGNFKLAPNAKVDDGLLDVYVFEDMSIIKRMINLPKVRKGSHLNLNGAHLKQVPRAEITLDCEVKAHLDGESILLNPDTYKIEVVPKGLEIISPGDN
ncbi:diacylglycerol kinase family lipid kinase [Desulfobacterota bacterium AH_259_B03_O07]|nr:diacylglycerol kinase family lipid kinase [Desulfobacterota bacterium AH_259_B03_O07]